MIDFDRCDARSSLGKSEGERTKTCADLNDMIVGADIGHTSYPTDGIGIRNKVLSKSSARCQAVLCQQFGDVAM
jgi:hypothetical protein